MIDSSMAERIVVGELPVGGQEPLISSAIRWGDLLFLSGRAPLDPSTLRIVSSDFEEQARNVLDQILASLAEGGSGPEHVLRVQCYLLEASDFDVWNRIWASTSRAPAGADDDRHRLHGAGMLIEVEVTAGIPA
jgi:enamine deaminase RidA (YjgF/YER057c/UK114 family)